VRFFSLPLLHFFHNDEKGIVSFWRFGAGGFGSTRFSARPLRPRFSPALLFSQRASCKGKRCGPLPAARGAALKGTQKLGRNRPSCGFDVTVTKKLGRVLVRAEKID
jgi:hypothetical protein